jgi:hypothetical protein
MSRVIDKDMGWAALVKQFAGSGASSFSAYIGPDPKDFSADGEPYYPLWVEFGTSRMAPRPFIRWTLDAHDDYRAEMANYAAKILRGGGHLAMSVVANLRLLGDQVAKDIQRSIQGLGAIDTGRMYHSVRVLRVVEGDAGGAALHAQWGG